MRLGDSQMHKTKTSCLGQLTKVKPLHIMFPIQQKPAILFPQWWTESPLSLIIMSVYLHRYANCWERVRSLYLRLIRPPGFLLQRRRVLPLPLCPREAPLKLKQITRIESGCKLLMLDYESFGSCNHILYASNLYSSFLLLFPFIYIYIYIYI